MKKVFFGTLLLTLIMGIYSPTMARAEVNVRIALPPPIVFAAPPQLIVLPETYVYVVPDVSEDIFFYNGWWWRPWGGHWYRSRYYNSGWAYYQSVPFFYRGIPSGWRNDYRDHRWRGHQWNYQRIPHQQVQQNWQGWKKNKHWEKQQTWGVQGLKTKEVVKPQQRVVKPQSKEVVKPQQRVVKPQSKEVVKPQQRAVKPQSKEVAKPQHKEADPQSREGQPQHPSQQQGDHERGK